MRSSLIRNRWSALLFMIVAALGCGPTAVTIDQLVGAAERNRFKALDEYEGDHVEVSGVVENLGMQRSSEVRVERGYFDVRAYEAAVDLPYVVLVPRQEAVRRRLLCYFPEDERSELGDLQVGQPVTLSGVFVGYERGTAGAPVPKLTSCRVR